MHDIHGCLILAQVMPCWPKFVHDFGQAGTTSNAWTPKAERDSVKGMISPNKQTILL